MQLKKGYIMPHPPVCLEDVGGEQLIHIEDTREAMISIGKDIGQIAPERIIVISPHGPTFVDAINVRRYKELSGDLSSFKSSFKLSKMSNLDFVDLLINHSNDADIPVVAFDEILAAKFNLDPTLDHGVTVPLSFIEPYHNNYELIVIHYGFLSEVELYQFGDLLSQLIERSEKSTVLLASGDLSHCLKEDGPYGFKEEGLEFDQLLVEALKGDRVQDVFAMDQHLQKEAGECGKRSIDIFMGAMNRYDYVQEVLSYEHPFGVGYLTMCYEPKESLTDNKHMDTVQAEFYKRLDQQLVSESAVVKLARQAVVRKVMSDERLQLDEDLEGIFYQPSQGVFVSIKDYSGLRGCMGTIGGTQVNLGEEIIYNALQAATKDPRFDAIESWELDRLTISVDVLGPLEAVDNMDELNPKKYGVVVEKEFRRGLLLPNLEGIDTVYDQIKIALNKAGISESEDYSVYKFRVTRYH